MKEPDSENKNEGKYKTPPDEKKNAGEFSNFLKSGEENLGFIANIVSDCKIETCNSVVKIKIPREGVLQQRLSGGKDNREKLLVAAEQFFGCKAEIGFFEDPKNEKKRN